MTRVVAFSREMYFMRPMSWTRNQQGRPDFLVSLLIFFHLDDVPRQIDMYKSSMHQPK